MIKEENMIWSHIKDFRDDAVVGGARYELLAGEEYGDISEQEATAIALPDGTLPEHVWQSGGRWLAE